MNRIQRIANTLQCIHNCKFAEKDDIAQSYINILAEILQEIDSSYKTISNVCIIEDETNVISYNEIVFTCDYLKRKMKVMVTPEFSGISIHIMEGSKNAIDDQYFITILTMILLS